MTTDKTIGIVAGAGPFAGLDLLKKIFEQTRARLDQEHLPVIGLFRSALLPDRTEYLLDPSLPNPGIAIARQVLELEAAGASVVAIPCNTAHAPAILQVMQAELQVAGSKVQFVNMLQETARFIRTSFPGLRSIGILATTGTYRSGIYPAYLMEHDLQAVLPDEAIQTDLIHPAIYDTGYGIKANGHGTTKARNGLLQAIAHLRAKGADVVILGCTEIPLAIPEPTADGMRLFDPALILARALIRAVDPCKLKPFF